MAEANVAFQEAAGGVMQIWASCRGQMESH
jgi:hypothetical protein